MKQGLFWMFLIALALPGSFGIAEEKQAQTQTAPAITGPVADEPKLELEPKAMEIIKAACDKLASARTLSFTAVGAYEQPSLLAGLPLIYTTKSEILLQRPDKIRVITTADGPATEFYYDGKTMTAFSPAENLVATADAPPTIDSALEEAYRIAGIYYTFTDLVVGDPYKDVSEGLMVAFYIGQSRVIGGITTDMVAYGNDKVFLQAWVGAEDRLPRMLRAVYRDDPSRLRHALELTNWKINPAVPEGSFASAKAKDAKRISFAPPEPQEERKKQ